MQGIDSLALLRRGLALAYVTPAIAMESLGVAARSSLRPATQSRTAASATSISATSEGITRQVSHHLTSPWSTHDYDVLLAETHRLQCSLCYHWPAAATSLDKTRGGGSGAGRGGMRRPSTAERGRERMLAARKAATRTQRVSKGDLLQSCEESAEYAADGPQETTDYVPAATFSVAAEAAAIDVSLPAASPSSAAGGHIQLPHIPTSADTDPGSLSLLCLHTRPMSASVASAQRQIAPVPRATVAGRLLDAASVLSVSQEEQPPPLLRIRSASRTTSLAGSRPSSASASSSAAYRRQMNVAKSLLPLQSCETSLQHRHASESPKQGSLTHPSSSTGMVHPYAGPLMAPSPPPSASTASSRALDYYRRQNAKRMPRGPVDLDTLRTATDSNDSLPASFCVQSSPSLSSATSPLLPEETTSFTVDGAMLVRAPVRRVQSATRRSRPPVDARRLSASSIPSASSQGSTALVDLALLSTAPPALVSKSTHIASMHREIKHVRARVNRTDALLSRHHSQFATAIGALTTQQYKI
ncbi:hypothetical protein RI367_006109 [Sorochytrium milnesiophthora]